MIASVTKATAKNKPVAMVRAIGSLLRQGVGMRDRVNPVGRLAAAALVSLGVEGAGGRLPDVAVDVVEPVGIRLSGTDRVRASTWGCP